jgi:hypothetical protein
MEQSMSKVEEIEETGEPPSSDRVIHLLKEALEHCSSAFFTKVNGRYRAPHRDDRLFLAGQIAQALHEAVRHQEQSGITVEKLSKQVADLWKLHDESRSLWQERDNLKEAKIGRLQAELETPIEMRLICPDCHTLHIDTDDQPPHRIHGCQSCGCIWQPSVKLTIGVRFLSGCKASES